MKEIEKDLIVQFPDFSIIFLGLNPLFESHAT